MWLPIGVRNYPIVGGGNMTVMTQLVFLILGYFAGRLSVRLQYKLPMWMQKLLGVSRDTEVK